jgi:glycosyltransferase involved in cell wall biosynthesis
MHDRPLRILMIVNLPWDERLGAVRIWIELADELRSRGHTVEKFSLSDAFPGAAGSGVKFVIQQLLFTRRAAAFVRENASRFDVVDAQIGTLPYSRRELGLRGIIVARSVGLYRLYEKFERSVAERWPRPPQGKLAGRLFYRWARQQTHRHSERSLRAADLLNVPHNEEAQCLRDDMNLRQPIIVVAYGLTTGHQQALRSDSAPPADRLAQKRVCFVGMWSPRKGSHDWRRIIERVRQQVPGARFRFLGTMVNEETIRADIGPVDNVEFVASYRPNELSKLLGDCTVGAFPSYVEGFGLAVLEQLTAGIPTVAYDISGPRDMLQLHLPELLTPVGDVQRFADTIARVLQLPLNEYTELSHRSRQVEASFRWPAVADATIAAYEEQLHQVSAPVLFVQPFSIGSPGGGARILRALLDEAPIGWTSVCTSPEQPRSWPNELHLPSRPSWGRIEHSRLASLPRITGSLFTPRFRRELQRCATRTGARAIHAVPHGGLDFAVAQDVAEALQLPFFISLHDDLAYTAPALNTSAREAAMRRAWSGAAARFVISGALGQEYSRRYGAREFHVVTDGIAQLQQPNATCTSDGLRIYFMGLFHMAYERNLRALLEGLRRDVRVTLRCEHVRPQVLAGFDNVTVLPFADEAQVQRDIADADLLYMPIPFGEQHENFGRYSLSTKMVTYVGSGVPILYHGPADSAAGELLSRNDAAVVLPTLDPQEISRALQALTPERCTTIAANALALAQREFMIADQTRKFWGTIESCLTSR